MKYWKKKIKVNLLGIMLRIPVFFKGLVRIQFLLDIRIRIGFFLEGWIRISNRIRNLLEQSFTRRVQFVQYSVAQKSIIGLFL